MPGTVVAWYDFLVYGTAAALVFGKLFFPTADPGVGTIASLGAYAVGFVARPLGGTVVRSRALQRHLHGLSNRRRAARRVHAGDCRGTGRPGRGDVAGIGVPGGVGDGQPDFGVGNAGNAE